MLYRKIMLSDSIFETIERLLNDVKHYKAPPFNYGDEYKQQIVIAIANLLYVQYRLDGKKIDMYKCMGDAYDMYSESEK